ncbi:SHD1 domain-containing protein [Rubripirellula lacrimiformis]|nr:SHD1 domain-containing protein [Rubripirellula lacrimiformis]
MNPSLRHRRSFSIRTATTRTILAVSVAIGCSAPPVFAQNSDRIWVDTGGTFSVTASMVQCSDDSVVLLRADGGRVTIPLGMLSDEDQQYVAERKASIASTNGLRRQPPKPPVISPLPVFRIPSTAPTTASGATIRFDGPLVSTVRPTLPGPLPSDRAPVTLAIPNTRVGLPKIDFNMDVSPPIPVCKLNESGTRTTVLAASISGNIRLPGEQTRQQLLEFDAASGDAKVAMLHYETIRLLDHHIPSGQSLVLVNYDSLGSGGDLAVVDGWDSGQMGFRHRRPIETGMQAGNLSMETGLAQSGLATTGRATAGLATAGLANTGLAGMGRKLRDAQWIDREHVLLVFDRTMGLWNIVSGESVYQIDRVDSRATPAVSGGKRYIALPYEGGVELLSSATGESLGRIKVERQVPGVEFSPLGNQLAIATTRRVRIWDLPAAALAGDIHSRNSLGKGKPLWIDHDWLLTDSGALVSIFRGVPVWRYDMAGAQCISVGHSLAIFRKSPVTELSVVSLPHPSAQAIIGQIDNEAIDLNPDRWLVPGRSSWGPDGWVDRDIQISGLAPATRR